MFLSSWTISAGAGALLLLAAACWRYAHRARVRNQIADALRDPDPGRRRASVLVATEQGLRVNAALLAAHVAHEHDPEVLAALVDGVLRHSWEPSDQPAILQLRLWAHEQRRTEPRSAPPERDADDLVRAAAHVPEPRHSTAGTPDAPARRFRDAMAADRGQVSEPSTERRLLSSSPTIARPGRLPLAARSGAGRPAAVNPATINSATINPAPVEPATVLMVAGNTAREIAPSDTWQSAAPPVRPPAPAGRVPAPSSDHPSHSWFRWRPADPAPDGEPPADEHMADEHMEHPAGRSPVSAAPTSAVSTGRARHRASHLVAVPDDAEPAPRRGPRHRAGQQ